MRTFKLTHSFWQNICGINVICGSFSSGFYSRLPFAIAELTFTAMSLVRAYFSISLDGFGAGLNQDLENPIGVGGTRVFDWFFPTRTFQRMHGNEEGETNVDNNIAEQGFEDVGAFILGRNMFGPVRGPWPDDSWKGWWGEEPPYHTP